MEMLSSLGRSERVKRWGRWLPRLLLTVGIILATTGLYVAVAGNDLTISLTPVRRTVATWTIHDTLITVYALLHLPRSVPLLLVFDALYSVVTLGGLALLLLVWRPLSPAATVRLRWIAGLWLVLLTTLAVVGEVARWQSVMQDAASAASSLITVGPPYLLPGILVFPFGVVLCGVALLFRWEPLPTTSPPAIRTRWQWVFALLLTAGVALWGVGFYLMPQAVTDACPPVLFSVTQVAHGGCAGIDSDQVLAAAANAGLPPLALFFYTLSPSFELLVALGCLTVLSVWLRLPSFMAMLIPALWLALTLGVALVAAYGVAVVARQGFTLTATSVGWHAACGIIATFTGIGLVVLAQVGVWGELLCKNRRATLEQSGGAPRHL